MVSCHVILLTIHEISQKGFLNAPTYNLVISSGTVIGFSRNSGKRSSPLSCIVKNSLQYSPLKVSIGSGSLNILQRDRGMVPQLDDLLAWNVSLSTPGEQLFTIMGHTLRAQFQTSRLFPSGKKGMNNRNIP
jgi:hypothetical protein